MHKGVILLVKADNKEDAIDKVTEFLEPYGDGDVWDWYSIGNRWHNLLAPKQKADEFNKWVHEEYKDVFNEGGMYSVKDLENEKDRAIIQARWESMGLIGKNPYYDSYGFSLREEEESYNVVPLAECIETVTEWKKDIEKEKEHYWQKMIEAKASAESGNYDMSGYYAGLYKDVQYGSFCFESNVYDISEGVAENIPDDVTEYWAVIVDMHN